MLPTSSEGNSTSMPTESKSKQWWFRLGPGPQDYVQKELSSQEIDELYSSPPLWITKPMPELQFDMKPSGISDLIFWPLVEKIESFVKSNTRNLIQLCKKFGNR